jgi:predicted phage tail protein
MARVTAMNVGNVASVPAYSALTEVQGKTGAPPSLTFLTATGKVFGIGLQWGFPEGAEDTQRTEIWYSQTPNQADAIKLGDYAYPQNSMDMYGLAAGVSLFFWGRLVDKTGNIGPWYPTGAGVNGQSSSDATDILDYLNGQITKTQLAQELLQPIESIDLDLAGDETSFAGDTVNFAGTWTLLYAQQSGDLTLAKTVDTVAAQMNGFGALVQTETQARIDADTATASQITNVQAAIGATNANVQTNATAIANLNGSVSASYQIKVQIGTGGQYYAAGMAIGVDNSSGIAQSQVLFQADRFALINVSNNSTTTPFVIQGGQTFINQAFIGTGWITNAMIGGTIQSSALDSTGNPLWSINKTGAASFRGSSASGRTEIDGNGGRTYDANGTLRVRWGIW